MTAPTQIDVQVDQLQRELETAKDDRLQERFGWFAASGMLLMILSFVAAGVTCGSIVAVIYVALLLVFSRMWGIEGVFEALHTARSLLPTGKDDEK